MHWFPHRLSFVLWKPFLDWTPGEISRLPERFWFGFNGGVSAGIDQIDEELMDAAIGGELGMEGCGHGFALPDQNGKAFALSQNFDFGAGQNYSRGADEDGFERATWQCCVEGEDGGVALGSVGVAFDGYIEDAEAALVRVADFAGEENGAGAGAEDRFLLGEGFQGIEEAIAVEEFEHGGGLAAGEDEGIEVFEGFGGFDQRGLRAGFFESGGMAFVVALDGQDTYLGGILTGQYFDQCFSYVRRPLSVGIMPSYRDSICGLCDPRKRSQSGRAAQDGKDFAAVVAV